MGFAQIGRIARDSTTVIDNNSARIRRIFNMVTVPDLFKIGAGRVEYPDDPVTTGTDIVSNQTELTNLLNTSPTGRRIEVRANAYTSMQIQKGSTDLDFVLSNNASISGLITMNSGGAPHDPVTRIRITGGESTYNSAGTFGLTLTADVSHVLIDNMRLAQGINIGEFDGLLGSHLAFINTTIDIENNSDDGACFLTSEAPHIILANNDFLAGHGAGGDWGFRTASSWYILARNRFRAEAHRPWRMASPETPDTSRYILTTGNQCETDSEALWWDPNGGGVTGGEMRDVYSLDDSYYASAPTGGGCAQVGGTQGDGIANMVVKHFRGYGDSPLATFNGSDAPDPYEEHDTIIAAGQTPPTSPPQGGSWGADH